MIDHSEHSTVVEYAVQELFKGKSPIAAARFTKKKLHGSPNIFIDPVNATAIDETRLASALVTRMAEFAIKSRKSYKAGMEHFAIDGTLSHFRQKPTLRPVLEERVVQILARST